MADLEKVMGVEVGDIEKIMGIGAGDTEALQGFGIPSGPAWQGARGILQGRSPYSGSGANWTYATNEIIYRTIAAGSGGTTDFGDMDYYGWEGSSVSSGTRYIYEGGARENTEYSTNRIEYGTIASTGNGTDFGDLDNQSNWNSSATNGTIATVGVGGWSGSYDVKIESITIANVGNATTQGDLTVARSACAGVCSTTMAIHGGGYGGGTRQDTIDYVPWASISSDATDFGNLNLAVSTMTAGEDSTRGIWFGGYRSAEGNPVIKNNIQYISTASTGSAGDFGDTVNIVGSDGGTHRGGAMCNGTVMEVAGGSGNSVGSDVFSKIIQYITIQSTGNATDLSQDVDSWSSSGHGVDTARSVQGCSGN